MDNPIWGFEPKNQGGSAALDLLISSILTKNWKFGRSGSLDSLDLDKQMWDSGARELLTRGHARKFWGGSGALELLTPSVWTTIWEFGHSGSFDLLDLDQQIWRLGRSPIADALSNC